MGEAVEHRGSVAQGRWDLEPRIVRVCENENLASIPRRRHIAAGVERRLVLNHGLVPVQDCAVRRPGIDIPAWPEAHVTLNATEYYEIPKEVVSERHIAPEGEWHPIRHSLSVHRIVVARGK